MVLIHYECYLFLLMCQHSDSTLINRVRMEMEVEGKWAIAIIKLLEKCCFRNFCVTSSKTFGYPNYCGKEGRI